MTIPTLIQSLQDRALYDHPVTAFEVIETHISWVILTGPFAYKIKKPVALGFLDFSSLERRRRFCAEELRLNRRLAPLLYLDLVTITGSATAPRLNGAGAPMEYAVRMRQFDQSRQLDRVLAAGGLRAAHIDRLAATVATFHGALPPAPADSPFGTPDAVWEPVAANFAHIRPLLDNAADRAALERIATWSSEVYARLRDEFAARKTQGFIRECHGDMHLANMALIEDAVVIFDCLEFNESLRWIDVISEIAFVTMDLDDRHEPSFAMRFLNRYLELGGDYEGLRVLRYYQVYRAMVRAKVACIRLQQEPAATERQMHLALFRRYIFLAEQYTRDAPCALLITHGLSGSGKTLFSQSLVERLGAIRLRSDVERKRLAGMAATERATAPAASGLYAQDSSIRTYARLRDLAARVVAAGFPVIVDATFLRHEQRVAFRHLAASLRIPFAILDFRAPEPLLRQWITERQRHGQDASDATTAVLDHQLATCEPLTQDEEALAIRVDTSAPVSIDGLVEQIRSWTGLGAGSGGELKPANATADD